MERPHWRVGRTLTREFIDEPSQTCGRSCRVHGLSGEGAGPPPKGVEQVYVSTAAGNAKFRYDAVALPVNANGAQVPSVILGEPKSGIGQQINSLALAPDGSLAVTAVPDLPAGCQGQCAAGRHHHLRRHG